MIKGISDRRRLPRLGKIRLGMKVERPGKKPYPKALDHFRFDDAPGLKEVYGENCREIDIVIPVEDRDVYCEQARVAYRRSGKLCKCTDGEWATRVRVGLSDGEHSRIPKGQPMDPQGEKYITDNNLDVKVGDMFDLPCLGKKCPFSMGDRPMCKGIGRFMFLMPKIPKLGCYEISTGSGNSIEAINSYTDMLKAAMGRVSMVPLKLKLGPIETMADGKKKIVYCLSLVYEGDWTKLLSGGHKALPAPLPASSMPERPANDIPDDLVPYQGQELSDRVGDPEPPQAKTPPWSENPAAAARAAMQAPSQEEEPPEQPPEEEEEPPQGEVQQEEVPPPDVRKKEVRKPKPNWKPEPKKVPSAGGKKRKPAPGRLF